MRDSRVHNYLPRWNAAPSQELLVIRRNHRTGEVSLDPLGWGVIPSVTLHHAPLHEQFGSAMQSLAILLCALAAGQHGLTVSPFDADAAPRSFR